MLVEHDLCCRVVESNEAHVLAKVTGASLAQFGPHALFRVERQAAPAARQPGPRPVHSVRPSTNRKLCANGKRVNFGSECFCCT
jgi:hypothetical protein